MYRPWGGEVRFDGTLAERVPASVLASSVATVSQNITLFSGSIRDNLTMWNKHITDADLIRSAKDACIHDVITSKPGAYDFELTEGGSNFSGGQRQRLEIARALATNPSLLLLDEPAAGMNPQETAELTDFIRRIRDEFHLTVFMIEHHMDLVMDISDRIYVLNFGALIAHGTPEEIQNNSEVIAAYLGESEDDGESGEENA